ncbi:hypothetical protein VM98_35285, partial [Streptomyces rubellomurinus subsp. indigoferus]
FQRGRYWLGSGGRAAGGPAGLGREPADHPLLGAAVAVSDSGEYRSTGRRSARTHPWRADQAVGGAVALLVTAFGELAVRAGDEVGCDRVDELTLEAALVLAEREAVLVQLRVEEPDRD